MVNPPDAMPSTAQTATCFTSAKATTWEAGSVVISQTMAIAALQRIEAGRHHLAMYRPSLSTNHMSMCRLNHTSLGTCTHPTILAAGLKSGAPAVHSRQSKASNSSTVQGGGKTRAGNFQRPKSSSDSSFTAGAFDCTSCLWIASRARGCVSIRIDVVEEVPGIRLLSQATWRERHTLTDAAYDRRVAVLGLDAGAHSLSAAAWDVRFVPKADILRWQIIPVRMLSSENAYSQLP
jgi:hypothetical protein